MKQTDIDLIPTKPNPSPDYYCTWQTQLYATCGGAPEAQRSVLNESSLFENEKPYGWAHFYPEARADLIFVMDDSWDIPYTNNNSYYGSLILNKEKFPSFVENADNSLSLKRLSERIKALGWKGLGGWVCAQESNIRSSETAENYWKQCLSEANDAGFSYWKVDWGKKIENTEFRQMLTDLGHIYAPNLIIEHAVSSKMIVSSDVFRTYDVPAVLSIPMTMKKLSLALLSGVTKSGYLGLLNCEDEAYIGAAGGFTIGIMRHPYHGAFMNKKADMSFPAVHRDIKSKMYEIIRGARWHRIAPAFSVDSKNVTVSEIQLKDIWRFEKYDEEIEAWWLSTSKILDNKNGDTVEFTAPAAISRNCSLPNVKPDFSYNIPFVIASKNPNGVYSIATLGRTVERKYYIPRCDIDFSINNAEIIGVFGEYSRLTLNYIGDTPTRILAQDIAENKAVDITDDVLIDSKHIIIPGDLIHNIGTMAQPSTDTSEPGLVIKLLR